MYFALGLLCRKYNDSFLRLMRNDGFKTFLLLLFLFLFVFKYHHAIPYAKYILYLSDHLIIRVAGLFCVFSFFLCNSDFFARNGKLSQLMQFVGRRTLDIYLLHYFFIPDLSCCNEFLSTDTRAVLELVFGFGMAAIIIAVSLLCSAFIRNSEFLGHYLFGVKSDKYSY
jgi:fucose 4-O-acetylase-like acetyltransferase